MLFKREPSDTFLAAVGGWGGAGGTLEMYFARKKKVGVELTIKVKPGELL